LGESGDPLAAASATPPTGQFSYTEHGRAQQAANATLSIPAADNASSAYTVVIPAGQFRLRNSGSEPAEFNGMFFNLRVGGPNPLTDGAAEAAPGCAGISAAAVAATGVSAGDVARGVTDPYLHKANGHGVDSHGTVVHSIETGKDMFVVTYYLEPGFSTGWLVHTDEMAIITKGTLGIIEARDGGCKKVEEYSAGQAWAHKPHKHMGVNEGNETAVVRIIDFTQSPPTDCPHLR
jgi:hypothetical protein